MEDKYFGFGILVISNLEMVEAKRRLNERQQSTCTCLVEDRLQQFAAGDLCIEGVDNKADGMELHPMPQNSVRSTYYC